jgi:LmeA-like phospholipid-binding
MRRGTVFWLIALVALVAVLVVGDRVAAAVAENTAASWLATHAPVSGKPTVAVHRFPFITQALRGRYDDVEVTSDSVTVGKVQDAKVDAHLRGAHLALGDVFGGTIHNLPCDQVDGTLTVPYSELARLSGVPELTVSQQGNAVTVTAPLQIPDTDTTVRVTATGQVRVDGQTLRVQAGDVSVSGVDVPQAARDQLAGMLSVSVPVPPLPYGLQLRGITATSSGVALDGAASNVVLGK